MTAMDFDAAVAAYRDLVESNDDGALPLLIIDVKDDHPYLIAVQVGEDARPGDYVRILGPQFAAAGKEIEQIIFQGESWMRVLSIEDGEEGPLSECVLNYMRSSDGTERAQIIPFTRTRDGVTWREPIDGMEDGDLVEAMREALPA